MELKEALYTRRAVRSYTPDPVDQNQLLELIDAAIQAPSAVNEQSWIFCVVRNADVLGYVSQHAKAHMMANTPPERMTPHFMEVLGDPGFDIFYGAPVLVVIASATNGIWAVENCALAAENLMLAARAAGLGSCWIGFAQSWLRTPEGKALLHLPEQSIPVAPIIIGHPSGQALPVARKTPEIHWIGA
jgi:nitroreductase